MLKGIVKNNGEVFSLEGIGDTLRASCVRVFEAGLCLGVNENGAQIEMVHDSVMIKAEPLPFKDPTALAKVMEPEPKPEQQGDSEQKQDPDGSGVAES